MDLFRKGRTICTDSFDIVVDEIASTEVTMSGNNWVVQITSRQGRDFFYPPNGLKTMEDARNLKKELRNEYFW